MENKNRYKTHSVGMTTKGEPYAFQLEGYVSSPAPYFSAAHDDKKAFLSASIGLPCAADQLMALAKNEYDKEKSYVAPEFATIKLYGQAAEKFSSVLNKGRHVVVAGRLVWRQFTTKDGNPGERLEIEVDNLIDAGSFKDGVDPTVGSDIAVATLAYKSRQDGLDRTLPMACTVSGTVIGAKPLGTSPKGNSYLQFGIRTQMSAEKICDLANGTYNKEKAYDGKKTIINASVFGTRAEGLAKVIADGAIVVVSGAVEAREYNGNISYQIRPRGDAVTVIKYGPRDGSAPAPAAGSAAAAAEPDTSAAGNFTPRRGRGRRAAVLSSNQKNGPFGGRFLYPKCENGVLHIIHIEDQIQDQGGKISWRSRKKTPLAQPTSRRRWRRPWPKSRRPMARVLSCVWARIRALRWRQCPPAPWVWTLPWASVASHAVALSRSTALSLQARRPWPYTSWLRPRSWAARLLSLMLSMPWIKLRQGPWRRH